MHHPLTIMLVTQDLAVKDVLSNAMSRRQVKKMVRDLIYCQDGQKALVQFTNCDPHLIFVEGMLKDVSGFTLLEQFKQLNPKCYVVMLTGSMMEDEVRAACNLDVNGIVVRPYSADRIEYHLMRCYFTSGILPAASAQFGSGNGAFSAM